MVSWLPLLEAPKIQTLKNLDMKNEDSKTEQPCTIQNVSVSVLSDEEMREPIENALYATRRFLTTQATDLSEGILQYIKDAGYTIVRTER